MPDLHANFAYSTVATAPSPALSGTSLVVAAGQGALFPVAPFNLTVWPAGAQPLSSNAEIVRVTARTSDTLTITRAQEGTTARTIVVGDQVANTITVKVLTDVEQMPVGGILAGTLPNPSFAASSVMGTGDAQQISVATAGTRLDVLKGTAAAPDASVHSALKVTRTEAITAASITGDGGEQCAAIMGLSVGLSTTEAQAVGVFGGAKNSSLAAGGGDDACGLYGNGRITGSGTGVGIGGFMIGRRDNDTGFITGIEAHSANYGTVAGAWNATGFQTAQAVWINCSGNADSSAAIVVSNAFGRQFKVGLGFTAQVTGGLTGGVADATIRDDGNATRVFDINGTHTDILDTQGATISGKLFKITVPGTYTATNVTTDRSYDANATTIDELADALGSLIADLRTLGLVA